MSRLTSLEMDAEFAFQDLSKIGLERLYTAIDRYCECKGEKAELELRSFADAVLALSKEIESEEVDFDL